MPTVTEKASPIATVGDHELDLIVEGGRDGDAADLDAVRIVDDELAAVRRDQLVHDAVDAVLGAGGNGSDRIQGHDAIAAVAAIRGERRRYLDDDADFADHLAGNHR